LLFKILCGTISKSIKKEQKEKLKMQVVKYIMVAIYLIICLGLIILVMMQNRDSKGASGTITGSSTNNFYEKNKTRTREGKMKKWTIILGVTFLVYTIVLGIVYMI
jgi:preprotein translocase subunit SecG